MEPQRNILPKTPEEPSDLRDWLVLLAIVAVGITIPLYVYLAKKYCSGWLCPCCRLRGEPEDWTRDHMDHGENSTVVSFVGIGSDDGSNMKYKK